MHDLSHYLTELCGVTPCCDFRFMGSAAPLPSDTMWRWCGLVCELINHARTDDKDVRQTVQPAQAPGPFSVSVYTDNDSLGKYLDEYPADTLIRWAMPGGTSPDTDIHKWNGGSGIMIHAS